LLLGAAALVPLSGLRAAFLMALAMGAQNAVVHQAGRTRTSVTYVTGTLVSFGERLADALFSAGPAAACIPYLIFWTALVCGGAAGGIAHAEYGIGALVIPTAGVLILAAATGAKAWRRRRR
jgi:uncharacterized membrane protein YoaK (UPF0700 family)